jgi:hypothetical protein
VNFLFVAHFESGETVSEDQVSWDALQDKDKITSLQLVYAPSDLLYVIQRDLEKVLEACCEELACTVKATRQLLLDILHMSAEAKVKRESLFRELSLDRVLQEWTRAERCLKLELAEARRLPNMAGEVKRLDEQVRRLGYYLSVARQIRSNRLFWREQEKRNVTLTGSRRHRYFFFQFKEGEARIRLSGGTGLEAQTTAQTIGMVVSPRGHCVCATMNLLNGWTRVYYTTIRSLRLNMECYPYINLKEVK